jgi:hypothetical protein
MKSKPTLIIINICLVIILQTKMTYSQNLNIEESDKNFTTHVIKWPVPVISKKSCKIELPSLIECNNDVVYDQPVCGKIIEPNPCLVPPCPQRESWSTFSSSENACLEPYVHSYLVGSCKNKIIMP